VALWGPRGAVIHSAGEGTTVSIEAAGAALLGVTVDGSGGRFDLLDAAVRVTADDARVEGVAIRGALFGILVEQAKRVQVRDDDVSGRPEAPLGLRGDAIRLWEVSDSAVEGNRVRDSRDVVVWYSPRNHIARNEVLRGRYGTHLMYSHGNRIEGNRYVENVVGIFAMYSRDLAIEGNLVARSGGAAGVGLGTKESGNLDVRDNWFVANTVGLYLDTSPLYLDETNTFERNVFEFGDTAVVFHGGAARNRFEDNRFRDNGSPVRVEGRGNARDALWRGNEFGDYQGYDLDGDGFGDLPYELRSLSGALTARHPALAFLRGTPAMALVELVGRVVPLFQPETLLVDPAPRMRSDAPERAPGAG
jgi:nitrous oxidase accessory protein